MNQALRSTAIVSSLFPANVRDRLMGEENTMLPGKTRLKSFLHGNDDGTQTGAAQPIADLFPDCTGRLCSLPAAT
jgi:hypothetical protein